MHWEWTGGLDALAVKLPERPWIRKLALTTEHRGHALLRKVAETHPDPHVITCTKVMFKPGKMETKSQPHSTRTKARKTKGGGNRMERHTGEAGV